MGVRSVIAIRSSPSMDALFYNHSLDPRTLGPFLVSALRSAHAAGVPDGYPNMDRLITHIRELEPGLQLEDLKTSVHPNNVRFIFPDFQSDLEYVFEVVYNDAPSVTLWKAFRDRDDDARFAYRLLSGYVELFGESDAELMAEFDNVLSLAGMVESFYNSVIDEGQGAKAMFQDMGGMVDLTSELIKMGL